MTGHNKNPFKKRYNLISKTAYYYPGCREKPVILRLVAYLAATCFSMFGPSEVAAQPTALNMPYLHCLSSPELARNQYQYQGMDHCPVNLINQPGSKLQPDQIQTPDTMMVTQPDNFSLIPYYDATVGKWGYLDRTSRRIRIGAKYQWVRLFHHGIAEVTFPNPDAKNTQQNSLYGWIDTAGQYIFKPQFTAVHEVRTFLNKETLSGLKIVVLPDGKTGVIDLYTASWLIEPGIFKDFHFYDRAHYLADKKVFFADGKSYAAPAGCTITSVDREHRLFFIQKGNELNKGCCTWQGQLIVPPKYMEVTYIAAYHRYLASRLYKSLTHTALLSLLKSGDMSGKIISELLDESGKKLGAYRSDYIADVYLDSLGVFSRSENNYYFSLLTGAAVATPIVAGASNGQYHIFQNAGLYGLKDKDSLIVIQPLYRKLEFAGNKLVLAAKTMGAYSTVQGVLDFAGKEIIPFKYQRLEYADNIGTGSGFRGYKQGKYGILNKHGNTIVPFIYDLDVYYTGARAIVYKDHRSGVINNKGAVIIPASYKTIFSSVNREQDPDLNLNIKKNPDGDISAINSAPVITGEYYAVENESDQWGLMDSTGQWVIDAKYGYVSTGNVYFKKGWVSIEDAARKYYGKINILTGVTLPPVYDIIRIADHFLVVAIRSANTYTYQLLDLKGAPLSSNDYNQMEYIKDGQYLLCQKNGKYGVLDIKGQLLVPFNFSYLWPKEGGLLLAEKQVGGSDNDPNTNDQKMRDYFYVDIGGNTYLPK